VNSIQPMGTSMIDTLFVRWVAGWVEFLTRDSELAKIVLDRCTLPRLMGVGDELTTTLHTQPVRLWKIIDATLEAMIRSKASLRASRGGERSVHSDRTHMLESSGGEGGL
jgi:hypothetical protein